MARRHPARRGRNHRSSNGCSRSCDLGEPPPLHDTRSAAANFSELLEFIVLPAGARRRIGRELNRRTRATVHRSRYAVRNDQFLSAPPTFRRAGGTGGVAVCQEKVGAVSGARRTAESQIHDLSANFSAATPRSLRRSDVAVLGCWLSNRSGVLGCPSRWRRAGCEHVFAGISGFGSGAGARRSARIRSIGAATLSEVPRTSPVAGP